MIKRFIKVTNDLFRGSAPSIEDVKKLYDSFGIRKIVSLDADAGHKINRVCKLLGIEHIIIPIDMIHMEPIANLLNRNLYDLLIVGGPTFVHCLEGKDRTGMVIAMFKCEYMDWNCHDAIAEAKKLGFGLGLNQEVVNFYEKIVCMSCEEKHNHATIKHIDNNSADIIENSRDESLTSFDNADMKSFAPFLDPTRQYPQNQVYDYSYDQYPTRDNVEKEPNIEEALSDGENMPLVGLYDNDSGIKGVGPVDNGGGFVST